jgi:hypothetical protein
MGFGNVWIRPDGATYRLGKQSHEDFAAELDSTQDKLVKDGWLRITGVDDKKIHIELWNSRDDRTLELLEAYLFDKWYPRVTLNSQVAIALHRPVNAYVYFTKGDMNNNEFKELIEFLVKAESARSRR